MMSKTGQTVWVVMLIDEFIAAVCDDYSVACDIAKYYKDEDVSIEEYTVNEHEPHSYFLTRRSLNNGNV
jgi:hypothetical protein